GKPPTGWGADETAARLIAAGKIRPLIIVGVASAGAARAEEYMPIPLVEGVEPHGAEFIAFLAERVKPVVDERYRTKAAPTDTAGGGSDLGAVIALEAAMQRPDAFGMALCESMPLVAAKQALVRHFGAKKTWPRKIAFGVG